MNLTLVFTTILCLALVIQLDPFFSWDWVSSVRLGSWDWAWIARRSHSLLVVCWVHYGQAMVGAVKPQCGCRGHPLHNALAPTTQRWVSDRRLLSQTRETQQGTYRPWTVALRRWKSFWSLSLLCLGWALIWLQQPNAAWCKYSSLYLEHARVTMIWMNENIIWACCQPASPNLVLCDAGDVRKKAGLGVQ